MHPDQKPKIHNWNMYPVIRAREKMFSGIEDLQRLLSHLDSFIPRGGGRSYGDASLFKNIVSTRRHKRILSFDRQEGRLRCQSGVTIQDILSIVIPHGWFMPVTPGTKFVSIGGAIAADVHGKNHHREGSFSAHLDSMQIMLPDGSVVTCSKRVDAELFWATCGGMGLTGIILDAEFHLKPILTDRVIQTTIKASNLDDMFEILKAHRESTYSVAWIDTTARKRSLGRGILNVGEHAGEEDVPKKEKLRAPGQQRKYSIPFKFPNFVLNPFSMFLFNQALYHKQRSKSEIALTDINTFFYPLDGIGDWNRMYGRRGFLQYQYVVPKEAAKQSVLDTLTHIRERGFHAFLAGLKLFGRQDDLISFPMEGYTFGMDLPIKEGVFKLLNELDERVLGAGGRIYMAKDARMCGGVFRKGYPNAQRFLELVRRYNPQNRIQSLQSNRLEITS